MTKAAKILLAGVSAVLLSGCSSWMGSDEQIPLEGKRISVLALEKSLHEDPRLGELPVVLPDARRVDMWPQANGYPHNAMGHISLSDTPKKVWSYNAGADSIGGLMAKPVVVEGSVYVLDGNYNLSSITEDKGRRNWQVDLEPEDNSGTAHGGGIGFGAGRVFATTGYGELLAVEPETGEIAWRVSENTPFISAPTIVSGMVFALTIDNQILAYSAENGERLWSHNGLIEDASVLSHRSVASNGNILIVPYSSGELYALNVENGRVAWSESLSGIRRGASVSELSDISAPPVIDRGMVLAVSYGGSMTAIDLRRGARIWDREVGGYNMPWPAGDFVFVMDGNSEVVAMTRKSGRIRWVSELPSYTDMEDKTGAILWYGPVLAGKHLWVAGTNSELRALSAETGETVRSYKLSSSAAAAPIAVGGKLFVMTSNGQITAFE